MNKHLDYNFYMNKTLQIMKTKDKTKITNLVMAYKCKVTKSNQVRNKLTRFRHKQNIKIVILIVREIILKR